MPPEKKAERGRTGTREAAPLGQVAERVVGDRVLGRAAADAVVAAPAAPEPVVARDDARSGAAAADRWVALVQELVASNGISAMVRELALQAECVVVLDGEGEQLWRLRVERENLRAPALRERLQAAVSLASQRPARLEVEAGAAVDTPAARDAAERAQRQAEAERVIHDDPLVKALMSQYKTARIVPGSIKPH